MSDKMSEDQKDAFAITFIQKSCVYTSPWERWLNLL